MRFKTSAKEDQNREKKWRTTKIRKKKIINKNQIAEEVKQHYIKLTVLGKRLNHINRDQRVINRLGAPVVFFCPNALIFDTITVNFCDF